MYDAIVIGTGAGGGTLALHLAQADGKPLHPQQAYFVDGQTKVSGAAMFRMRAEDFGVIRHHGGISLSTGFNLLSSRSDPRIGTQTFTVTELDTGDPDPQLFKVPEGYQVVDQQTSPPISW